MRWNAYLSMLRPLIRGFHIWGASGLGWQLRVFSHPLHGIERVLSDAGKAYTDGGGACDLQGIAEDQAQLTSIPTLLNGQQGCGIGCQCAQCLQPDAQPPDTKADQTSTGCSLQGLLARERA